MEQPRSTKVSDSKAMRGSLHLYLQQVANEANNRGLTMRAIMKEVKHLEARPTIIQFKENIVKPYIEEQYNLKSTEKMDSKQVDEVYIALNKFFGIVFDIHFPFPSKEQEMLQNLDNRQYQ